MKYFLFILLIIALYALFMYGRFYYFVHYSKNPEIIQTDKTLGQGKPLRYIAAGDSTAVGEGASNVDQTYSVKIAQDFAQDNAVSYKNVAVRGAKTKDVINNQIPKIIEFNPDIVTISIGANDTTHLVPAKEIIENYKTIIAELANKTRAKIYITNIPNFSGANLLPWFYIKYLESNSKKVNTELLKLKTDRVSIINIHDYGWDKFPDISVTYSLDHFHPSDVGYSNWAEAFLSSIKSP